MGEPLAQRGRRGGLGLRLMRGLALVALAPLVILGAGSPYVARKRVREQVFHRNAALARAMVDRVHQHVNDGQGAILVAARQPGTRQALARGDLSALAGLLRTLYEESGLFHQTWLTDPAGHVRLTYPSGPLDDVAQVDPRYFQTAVRFREPVSGEVIRSTLAGRPLTIPYLVPVEGAAGEAVGLLVGLIDLREISDLLSTLTSVGTLRVYLVDKRGQVLADTQPSRIGETLGVPDVAWRAITGKSGVTEAVGADGGKVLAAYEYVPDFGWALVVQLSAAEAYEPIESMTAVFWFLLITAALGATGLAVATFRRITHPVGTLREGVRAIQHGDLDRRIELKTGDELEELAGAFNEMAAALQRKSAQRAQSEEALQRLSSELSAILDSIRVAVLGVDGSGHIRHANRRALEVLDRAPEALVGRPLPELLEAVRRRLMDGSGKTLAWPVADSSSTLEEELRYADRRTLVRQSQPVVPGETALGRIELFEDVTTLREQERLKNEFLLLISHEFRTPLTVALGGIELGAKLLAAGKPTPQVVRWLREARVGTLRVIEMVEQLLDVAAIDAGRLCIHLEPCPLPELVTAVLHKLEKALHPHPLHLQLAELPPVPLDRTRISAVLTNFLSNAARYTAPTGAITVRLRRQGDEALLSVEDAGPGIPQEDLSKLFNRFQRARNVLGGAKEGLGLGLYIGRHVLQAHGGQLWVEPAAGGGSVFSLSLPLGTEGSADVSA